MAGSTYRHRLYVMQRRARHACTTCVHYANLYLMASIMRGSTYVQEFIGWQGSAYHAGMRSSHSANLHLHLSLMPRTNRYHKKPTMNF